MESNNAIPPNAEEQTTHRTGPRQQNQITQQRTRQHKTEDAQEFDHDKNRAALLQLENRRKPHNNTCHNI